jgi:hypothetical protein
MSNESENEEEYDLPWKGLSSQNPDGARLQTKVHINKPRPALTMRLTEWQLMVIQRALCGRLGPEMELPARLLGLNIRRSAAVVDINHTQARAEKVLKQCDDEIAEIYQSVEMQKMKLDAWAKEQANMAKLPDQD